MKKEMFFCHGHMRIKKNISNNYSYLTKLLINLHFNWTGLFLLFFNKFSKPGLDFNLKLCMINKNKLRYFEQYKNRYMFMDIYRGRCFIIDHFAKGSFY